MNEEITRCYCPFPQTSAGKCVRCRQEPVPDDWIEELKVTRHLLWVMTLIIEVMEEEAVSRRVFEACMYEAKKREKSECG